MCQNGTINQDQVRILSVEIWWLRSLMHSPHGIGYFSTKADDVREHALYIICQNQVFISLNYSRFMFFV